MATRVTIIKDPLYGKVVWTGDAFVYTPNVGFVGTDYYVYTMTDGVTAKTETTYVNTLNAPPSASNITLSANASEVKTIDINGYVTDPDGLTIPVKLLRVSPTKFGSTEISGNNITYRSNGYNSNEIFTYTVTDGQYTSTGTINISVIGGADTVIPDYVLNSVTQSETIVTNVAANSSTWNETYTFVSTKSAGWNQIDNSRYNNTATLVENNSANWNSVALAKPSYDAATSVVQTNSAGWNAVKDNVQNLSNNFSNNSASWSGNVTYLQSISSSWVNNTNNVNNLSSDYYTNKPSWSSAYSTVNSNSASWDKTSLTNAVSPNSSNWNDSHTVLSQNSAKWDTSASDISALKSIYDTKFQNWNSAYSTVQSNSAVNWNAQAIRSEVSANSASWDNTYNVLAANSANWNGNFSLISNLSTTYVAKSGNWESAYNIVNSNSAKWDNTYSNVVSNSAKWVYGASDINFATKNLTAYGNIIVAGSLSAAGGVTQTSTSIVSTSAFDVINIGTETALNVTKTQTTGGIATFTIGGSPVLYISPNSKVGINTSNPNVALTVVGDISASGTIYGAEPPEYTVFRSNSAKYEASNTYFSTLCALLTSKPSYDNAFNYVSGVSGGLNSFLSLSAPLYDSAYTVLTGQSANNNSSYTSLQTVSSKFGTDTVYRTVSGNYETAYSYITATSAAWVTNNPKFNSLSAASLTAGNVYLTNALLTSFSTPLTATENFLSISVNGVNRLIQLWQ